MTSNTVARRLAIVTAAMTLLLIVAGGLVTNTGAGLAVPDWPTTFGYNMFTYPWSQMVGGIFYEHSHRLLGSVVGLLTLALAAALWPLGGRLCVLGLVAVAVVILQGVLGGLRVTLLELRLAIVHGCLAQAYFALIVAIAVLAWPRASEKSDALGGDSGLSTLTTVAAALVYVQIVFGALLTHTGRLHLHLIGALAVFALVPVVTARARRTGDPIARTASIALLALLGVQLLLGVGAWVGRFTDVVFPGGTTTGLAMPVLHRLAGSLILGATIVLALRVRLAGRAARASSGVPQLATAGRSAT